MQQAEHTAYRVKQGYSINLPFHRVVRAGELLENPSPELVRLNAWKLEPVAPLSPSTPLPAVIQPPEGVSIIIPAWKSADFLEGCLDSLVGQGHFSDGIKYEILLGIDGCQATKNQALKIAKNYANLQVYWFEENYGPYILKNSLASLAKHPWLLFFDADDTAKPEMLESLFELNQGEKRAAVYMSGEDTHGAIKQTCGIFLIWRRTFLGVGGFMPWRCAADTEFLKRLPAAQISHRCVDQVLMHRRVHENQLTVKADTGFGSKMRACYMKQIRQIKRLQIANIGLVTVDSERIY